MIMKLSPEVLIYIQNVKTYFEKNKEAREFFLENSDEKLFFEHLGEISQKNYEEKGEVMLDREQFDLLNRTIRAIKIAKSDFEKIEEPSLFFDIPNFGQICLN